MTALTELALQYGDYRAYGYRVERYDARTWILRDSTGAQLMVANYGGLSPTRGAAELEAYARIALAHHRATPCERAATTLMALRMVARSARVPRVLA